MRPPFQYNFLDEEEAQPEFQEDIIQFLDEEMSRMFLTKEERSTNAIDAKSSFFVIKQHQLHFFWGVLLFG